LATAALPRSYHPVAVAALRLLLGGALLLLTCRPAALRSVLRGAPAPGRRGPAAVTVATVIAAAGALAAYQGLYFMSLNLAGVAVGTVVQIGSVPVFVGVMTLVTGGGRPSRRWVIATGLAVAGSAALTLPGMGSPAYGQRGASPVGVLCAIAAGCAYAVFTMLSAGQIRRGADSRATMAVLLFGGGVLLSPVLLVAPIGWLGTGQGISVVGYLAVVSTMLAYILYGRGLRTVAPTTATTFAMAEPASAAIVGIVVLHEAASLWSGLGLALVAVALVVLSVRASSQGVPAFRRTRVRNVVGSSGTAARSQREAAGHSGRWLAPAPPAR
jgi:DME family drug/metabolite transporter